MTEAPKQFTSMEWAESDLCDSRVNKAQSMAKWSHPNAMEPAVQGQNTVTKVGHNERSKFKFKTRL
jgi:hypothetical protein